MNIREIFFYELFGFFYTETKMSLTLIAPFNAQKNWIYKYIRNG